MKVLLIDGHNFLHRARKGFSQGKYGIVFTFFRNLRALLETMDPTKCVFVLEGKPKHRFALMPNYKANRIINKDKDAKKYNELKDFHRQKDLILELLKNYFPISVLHHPDYECDDTIYNIINSSSKSIKFTVVSNDSDFIQLLNKFDNCELYNPMKKDYRTAPNYDYVAWKSLVGDKSDNIDGINGIGPKRAEKLLANSEKLTTFFLETPEHANKFNRNYDLIKFATWTPEIANKTISYTPKKDWNVVIKKFNEWNFESLLKEKYWTKFTATFDELWRRSGETKTGQFGHNDFFSYSSRTE